MRRIRVEADLQGLLTPVFRLVEVLDFMGVLAAGSMGYEAKFVRSSEGRKGWGSKVGRRRVARLEGKGRLVELIGEGSPWWRVADKGLGYSKIEDGQRTSLNRSGCLRGYKEPVDMVIVEPWTLGDVLRGTKPLSYKISDSAVGFKPYDGIVLWGAWTAYVLGWGDGEGGIVRAYVIEDWKVEELLSAGKRGSVSEVEAWEMCTVCLVWE